MPSASRLAAVVVALVSSPLVAQVAKVETGRPPAATLAFTATEGTWIDLDVAPDGRTLVFDLLGHLYEMPIGGGTATALTSGGSYNHRPHYSPDGTRILFTSDRTGTEELWILHRGTDSLEQVTRTGYRAFAGTWAPDGRHIYVSTADINARYQGSRIDLFGSKTEIVSNGFFQAATHFAESAALGKVFFSQTAGPHWGGAFQIKTYDLTTGEIDVYLRRVGGAADPVLSPDGRYLVYIHRDDLETRLILHELATQKERVLVPKLDRDRMEAGIGITPGIYPDVSWHPSGREIFFSQGGKIHAVNVQDGAVREIPFRAQVRRELTPTIRFPVTIPEETARTRSHRFSQRTDLGILSVALGDLYLRNGAQVTNLTRSRALESNPVYDPATRTVYYAAWTDDSLGTLWSLSLGGANRGPVRLPVRPGHLGALALSADGRTLAYLRGADDVNRGVRIVDQDQFTLTLLGPDRVERAVAQIKWKAGPDLLNRLVPGITFAPDGRSLYVDEIAQDTLAVKRIGQDGAGDRTLLRLPQSPQAVVSPDLRWVAFREYSRTWLTPLVDAGTPATVVAFDHLGPAFRVDSADGEDLRWSADSRTLQWGRGSRFYEKDVADIVGGGTAKARSVDLGFDYPVARPAGVIALTNARVITMDAGRRVLDGATIVVRQNRIDAVGVGIAVPPGARVLDLAGKTVIPGLIDAHGHYDRLNSVLGVLDQNQPSLLANLAYGTTTLYELYGNHLKDAAVSDLERAGLTGGSRLLSVGPAIYGLRGFGPRKLYPLLSQADADAAVAFNQAFGATAIKDYTQYTRAARQRLYEAARRAGLNVMAESAGDFQMNWTMLMDGVSGIEHTVGLTPLYDDVRRLWSATGAGNTPTLLVTYNGTPGETVFHQAERLWEDPKLLHFFPRETLLRYRRPTHYFDDDVYAVEMATEVRKLAQAGVSIQLSGHGQMHGLDKHWEMELMARGGFTPIEILAAGTIASARYLGLDRQLGSLEPGKLADLVILDANPLDDIRNARRIDRVMKNGVLYSGNDGTRIFPD